MTNLVTALIICLFIPITNALKVMLWKLVDETDEVEE